MILYQVGEIFQIYFHAWCLVKGGSRFSKWVASCFNTMFWKDYSLPPLNYSGTFAENKLTMYLCADFWTFQSSALMYLSLCQYHTAFIAIHLIFKLVLWVIQLCVPFSKLLTILSYLNSYINFKTSLPVSFTKHIDVWFGIALNL